MDPVAVLDERDRFRWEVRVAALEVVLRDARKVSGQPSDDVLGVDPEDL